MYNVVFYEKSDGSSELWELLESLRSKMEKSKSSRIQYRQMIYYIELLQQFGTRLSDKVTKYISDDIWELRPGGNRIFYFFHCDNTFVLLHAFRKKTQKTPKREIEKAKAERADYLSRKDDLP